MFDYCPMTVTSLRGSGDDPVARSERIHQLRQRMHRMQPTTASHPLPTVPALTELVRLRTGASYAVDRPVLAMTLMAGPSAAGSWSAVVGVDDFGAEAAAELGVDLEHTVLVTDPGDAWLEVTAALIDVLPVVVVRPPGEVNQHQASRLAARLRKRDAMLVAVGNWPQAEARLWICESSWTGIGRGSGRLTGHRVLINAESHGQRNQAGLWLPQSDQEMIRVAEDVPTTQSHDGLRVLGAG